MYKTITIKLFQIVNVNNILLLILHVVLYSLIICSMPKDSFAESLALSVLGPTSTITSINQSTASDGTIIFSIKGSDFEAEGCTSIIVEPSSLSQSTELDGTVIFSIKSNRFEAEGCTSVQRQPMVMQESKPAPLPVSKQAPVPVIISISPLTTEEGNLTLTINGNGLDDEALVEVYDSTGKYIGSGVLSGKLNRRTSDLSKIMKEAKPGKYTVKVKNPNGQYSKPTTLTINEAKKSKSVQKKSEQCDGNSSENPRVLYLGGGDATKLFERYLSQNSKIESTLPRDIKIKFYQKEKETSDLSLQTVVLGDMEQLFVESQEDFLNKIKKQLKGRVAELTDTLADDAVRENADYFQCPVK